MADSLNKKEREKKLQKKKKEKAEKRERKKLQKDKPIEFMYIDEDGNLSEEMPDLSLRNKTKLSDIEISTRKKDKSADSGDSKFTKLGIVKFFNTEKGYGFIADKDTNESYFVHVDNLRDKIKDNDKVSFEVGKGPKGPIATDVKLVLE